VNLDGNILTDKCLESLFTMLTQNKSIKQASLKGIKISSKLNLQRVKEYGDRIII